MSRLKRYLSTAYSETVGIKLNRLLDQLDEVYSPFDEMQLTNILDQPNIVNLDLQVRTKLEQIHDATLKHYGIVLSDTADIDTAYYSLGVILGHRDSTYVNYSTDNVEVFVTLIETMFGIDRDTLYIQFESVHSSVITAFMTTSDNTAVEINTDTLARIARFNVLYGDNITSDMLMSGIQPNLPLHYYLSLVGDNFRKDPVGLAIDVHALGILVSDEHIDSSISILDSMNNITDIRAKVILLINNHEVY